MCCATRSAIRQFRCNLEDRAIFSSAKSKLFAIVRNKLNGDNRGAKLEVRGVTVSNNEATNLFLTEFSKNFASIIVSNVPAGHSLTTELLMTFSRTEAAVINAIGECRCTNCSSTVYL